MCKGGTSTIKLPIDKRDKKRQHTLLELVEIWFLIYNDLKFGGILFYFFV